MVAAICGLIVVATFAFVPASWPALSYFDPPKRAACAMLGALLLIRRLLAGRSGSADALDGTAFALAAWILLRAVFRPEPWAEWVVVAAWLLPLVIFVAARGSAPDVTRPACWTVVLLGLGQSLLMLLQFAGYDPLFGHLTSTLPYRPGRMLGTIGYQNQAFDLLALGAFACFAVTRRIRTRVLLLLLPLAAMLCTAHRGGLVAVAAALATILALGARARPRRWLLWGAGLALLAGLLLAALPDTRARFQSALRAPGIDLAMRARFHFIRVGWDIFTDHPVLGAGPGAYALQYVTRLGDLLPDRPGHDLLPALVYARETHLDGLQFAAEMGLVGSLLAAGVLVLAIRARRRSDPPPETRYAFAGILVYMSVASLSSFPWQTALGGPLAGLLLGLLVPPSTRPNPDGPTRLLLAPLTALALVLAFWTTDDLLWNSRAEAAAAAQDFRPVARLPRWGHIYGARFGSEAARLQRWPEAVLLLEQAHRGNANPALLSNLAQAYGRVGRWPEAEALHRRWVRSGLDHERALHDWSLSLEALGRFADAAGIEAHRLELWPPHSSYDHLRVAALQLKAGAPAAALAYLQHCYPTAREKRERPGVHLTDGEIRLCNLMAASHLMLEQPEEARPWIAAALRHDPTNAPALANQALLPDHE